MVFEGTKREREWVVVGHQEGTTFRYSQTRTSTDPTLNTTLEEILIRNKRG